MSEADDPTESPNGWLFELRPGQYSDRPLPSDKKSFKIARGRRILAEPMPDPQDVCLTGRYQSSDGTFLVGINQAGTHLTCWVSEAWTGAPTPSRKVFRLWGDRVSSDTFELNAYPSQSELQGNIFVNGDDVVMQVQLGGHTARNRLVLNELRPTLSDSAMSALANAPPVVIAGERFPLTREAKARLHEQLSAKALTPLLDAYYDVGSGKTVADRLNRASAARRLDAYIAQVLSDAGTNRWHPFDVHLTNRFSQQLLKGNSWVRGDTKRSFLEWMRIVVDTTQRERFGTESITPSLQEHLAIEPVRQAPDDYFFYDLTIVAAGRSGSIGLGVSGFFGSLQIVKHAGPRKETPVVWKKDFKIFFAGVSAGFSFELQMGTAITGKATSPADFSPNDIPGWISFATADYARAGIGAGLSYGSSMMFLEGTGVHPKLAFDLTGVGYESTIGGSLANVGMSFGYIWPLGKHPRPVKPEEIKMDTDYVIEIRHDTTVHFKLGDALITQAGRQALRACCAAELNSFAHPDSTVSILGHADRVDTADRNEELSRLRAENVKCAIKDILGDQLKVPDEHIRVYGLGEREAAKAGDIDGKANPNFRKVEVVVNSRLVLSARGA